MKAKIGSKSLIDEGSISRPPGDYGEITPYPTMAYKGKIPLERGAFQASGI